MADLAARLEIKPEAIEIISVTNDQFAAQDLGCPSAPVKGGPVLPAFVMGQVIRLRANDTVYEYHAHGGELAFCSPPPP